MTKFHPGRDPQHYRYINYPADLDEDIKARYEQIADLFEQNATEPICLSWALEEEDWVDNRGCDPPRNCLLITKHVQDSAEGVEPWWTFGDNLVSILLH